MIYVCEYCKKEFKDYVSYKSHEVLCGNQDASIDILLKVSRSEFKGMVALSSNIEGTGGYNLPFSDNKELSDIIKDYYDTFIEI